MKSSLLTATACLVVVVLAATVASAQTYPSGYSDGYRGGAPDWSSYRNVHSYPNPYPQPTSNSYSHPYGNSYAQPYGSSYAPSTGNAYATPNGGSYDARQYGSYGMTSSNPNGTAYGESYTTNYQTPRSDTSYSSASGPAGQTQSSVLTQQSTPGAVQPEYGSVVDNYDESCNAGEGCRLPQTRPVQWMVSADLLFMTRVPGNSYALLKVPNPVPPPPFSYETVALDVADFDFDYELGYRISASRMVCDGWGVEAGFFAMTDGWDYGVTMSDILELQGPGWQVGSDPNLPDPTPVTFRVNNTSEFYSGELNLARGICDWATLRMGLRYIEFNDRLEVDELHTPLYNLLVSTTDNNLFGAQFGGDFKLLELKGGGLGFFGGHFGHAGAYGLGRANSYGDGSCGRQPACRFRINAMFNCGVFYNYIEHDPYSAFFGPPLASEANEIALLGEMGLTAKYRLTDHVAIRGGYHVLALHGVALAPDQIRTSDVVTETTYTELGSLIAHGATFGVEVFW